MVDAVISKLLLESRPTSSLNLLSSCEAAFPDLLTSCKETRPMRFGDLELIPVSDGTFRLDGGAMFGVVPKPLWEKRAPADARNRIRCGLRPLVVRGDKTLI